MNVAVIIPYGRPEPWRDRALRFVWAYWRENFPDWPLQLSRDERLPFRKASAQNTAAAGLPGEIELLVFADADSVCRPESVRRLVELARAEPGQVLGFTRYQRLSRAATERLASYHDALAPDEGMIEWEMLNSGSHGLMAIRRDCFAQVGGLDPKFVGWGAEDLAFDIICDAHWPTRRVEGTLTHLWHPRAVGSDGGPAPGPEEAANLGLYQLYVACAGDRSSLQELRRLEELPL